MSQLKPFVAVDVEGRDRDDGSHELILVGAADAAGRVWQLDPRTVPADVSYTAGAGARTPHPTDRILDWLVERSSDGILVGWWIDYDISMVLGALPDPCLRRLADTGQVIWGRWIIEHRPDRYLTVVDRRGRRRATWWNLGSVGGSLVSAAAGWGLPVPDIVRDGKAGRDGWDGWSDSRISAYNGAECQLTARLAERIRRWTRSELRLNGKHAVRSWTVGGVAGQLLADRGGPGYEHWSDDQDRRRVQTALVGGRHEALRYGPVPRVWAADINSAYAAAGAALPCLDTSHGVRLDPMRSAPDQHDDTRWWLGSVTWSLDERHMGPFPVRRLRDGREVGSLVYPAGWDTPTVLWGPEIDAARRVWEGWPGARGDRRPGIQVDQAWQLTPCLRGCSPRLRWLQDLYTRRLSSDPGAAAALKLVLAGVWGKLAQTAGKAPHQHLTAAGLVTSTVRGWLLDATRLYRDSIVSIGGDALVSTCRLPLRTGHRLGEWRQQQHRGWWQAQAGLGWSDSRLRSRGYRSDDIDRPAIARAWEQDGWDATIDMSVRQFVGYRMAHARGDLGERNRWSSISKTMRLDPRPRRYPLTIMGRTRPPDLVDVRLSALTDTWTPDSRQIRESPV